MRPRGQGQRLVAYADDDDGARAGQQAARIEPALRLASQVGHLAVIAGAQPADELLAARRWPGRRKADQIEAQFQSALANEARGQHLVTQVYD